MDGEHSTWGMWALVAFMTLSLGYRTCVRAEPWVAPSREAAVPGVVPLSPSTPGFRALLAGERVDLNTASDRVLQQLPGIGPSLSARIRRARDQAPLRGLRDLERVRGLGPRSVAKLEPFVRFVAPPVDQGAPSAFVEGSGGNSTGAPDTGSKEARRSQ